MEVPFDGDLVETEFNEILEDYLNMQGRSDSDEGNSDYDGTDDSSSANDSDIGRAISADIVGDGVVEQPLQPRPGSDTPARPTASTSSDSHSGVDVVDVKRDAGCKCSGGECIDRFGRGDILLTRTINAGLDKEQLDLLLLGKVSTFIRRGNTTRSTKKRAHERTKVRCNYTHEGKIFFVLKSPVSVIFKPFYVEFYLTG